MAFPVGAALKIIWDVASFRLRRLEMANLAAAFGIMLTFRLPIPDLGGRLAFGFFLNLLVYLNNDFHDIDDDTASSSREPDKTAFLRTHRSSALGAQLGLLAILIVFSGLWKLELLVTLVLGGGICWAYSARLKHMPGFDVAAMTLWGICMPLLAFPLDRMAGYLLVAQLGLFSAVFESIQVLRDREQDVRTGTNTLAVRIGERGTRAVVRGAMVCALVYGALVLSPLAAAVGALAVFLPIGASIPAYWMRVRAILGVAFLIECISAWHLGHTAGVFWQVDLTRTI